MRKGRDGGLVAVNLNVRKPQTKENPTLEGAETLLNIKVENSDVKIRRAAM